MLAAFGTKWFAGLAPNTAQRFFRQRLCTFNVADAHLCRSNLCRGPAKDFLVCNISLAEILHAEIVEVSNFPALF